VGTYEFTERMLHDGEMQRGFVPSHEFDQLSLHRIRRSLQLWSASSSKDEWDGTYDVVRVEAHRRRIVLDFLDLGFLLLDPERLSQRCVPLRDDTGTGGDLVSDTRGEAGYGTYSVHLMSRSRFPSILALDVAHLARWLRTPHSHLTSISLGHGRSMGQAEGAWQAEGQGWEQMERGLRQIWSQSSQGVAAS
jgi:hypothetical protein